MLWADMEPRIRDNRFSSVGERMALQRSWMRTALKDWGGGQERYMSDLWGYVCLERWLGWFIDEGFVTKGLGVGIRMGMI